MDEQVKELIVLYVVMVIVPGVLMIIGACVLK